MSNAIPLSEFEGRGQAAQFEQLGDQHEGRIVSIEQGQQTDVTTGQPKFWADGRPQMQWLITIAEADGENRVLYARGGAFDAVTGSGWAMQDAIVRAVKEAKADSVAPGAQLVVRHTGLGKATGVGRNPPKLYTAAYRPPAPQGVPVDDLFTTPAPGTP